MKNAYVFDQPKSEGVKNAIARARQLCEIEWSAKRECIVNDNASWGFVVPMRAGREHRFPEAFHGVPYSSTRVLDKIVGLDISLSTFVSATENPTSIVYTRELSEDTDPAFHPRISNVHFAYGAVCSSLASYAMDLPLHYSTREWDQVPELYQVAKTSIDEIALADTMVTFNKELGRTGGHLSVITDIARDSEGRVCRVEITEGWEPTQRARWDSREKFEARMLFNGGNTVVYRHKSIDSIRPPMEIKHAPTELCIDLGAFSAYKEEDAVLFNITAPADALLIENECGEVLRIPSSDFENEEIDGVTYTVIRKSLPPAMYKASLERKGQRSAEVLFSVVRAPRPAVTKADGSPLPHLAFTPVATDGSPLTESSSCLYKKDTDILLKTAPFAYLHEGKLYEAYGALRRENGGLVLYPSIPMLDEEGKAVRSFKVGAQTVLYLAACKEGEVLAVDFAGARACKPYSLCPKEEAAVTFDQRLLRESERESACLSWQAIPSPYNRFVGLSIVYQNEYGRVTSDPFFMIVL